MKGQMHLMEYVFMTLFIVIIIVILIFFLSGWQITQFQIEGSRSRTEKLMSLTRQAMVSPYLTKESGIFDDGKLTALGSLEDTCQELRNLFGQDWFIEVRIWDGSDADMPCTWGNYPDCNSWSFCKDDREYVSYLTPVNIYRKIGFTLERGILGRTYLGTLEVGVYE